MGKRSALVAGLLGVGVPHQTEVLQLVHTLGTVICELGSNIDHEAEEKKREEAHDDRQRSAGNILGAPKVWRLRYAAPRMNL